MNTRYLLRRAQGMCGSCGVIRVAYESTCASCKRAAQVRRQKNWARVRVLESRRQREARKLWRRSFVRGIYVCTLCGTYTGSGEHRLCDECRVKGRDRQRAKVAARKVSP